ncbi:MAG: 3-dehydroquinate synthase [Actinomycetota bacterium]|nr:3-dehydroquinate synthase [Actinomycetota bacterium]
MSACTVVRIDLAERGYDVMVGKGLVANLARHVRLPDRARRAVIVTQPPVAGRYAAQVRVALSGAGLDVHELIVPDGEQAKDVTVLANLYSSLARIPLGRADVIFAVGGGVVGDLAGFLAATWHRGVGLVLVPTTLVGQVDAAIGGKTAINLPEGKNLVGAFHQPLAVVADVDALATLPRRQLVAGLAEVVKYGLIADPAILDILEANPNVAAGGEDGMLERLVVRSVAVKAAVVAEDERETGRRSHLNFGHTYGHAMEAVTGYTRFLHGEAVAVGTCVALRLGAHIGLTPPGLVERGEALLRGLGLPVSIPPLDRRSIWAAMRRDKKAQGDVRFVLLEGLARPVLATPPTAAVDAAMDEVETATPEGQEMSA